MAFNPEVAPIVQTGQISSSRGTDVNDALGVLFKGIGNTMDNYLNAKMQTDQTNLSLNTSDWAEQTGQEMLESQLPEEITNGVSEVNRYAEAAKSRPDIQKLLVTKKVAKRKELVAKYPHLRDQIDQQLNSAAGSNASIQLAEYNEKLQREADANVSELVKYNRQYAKENDDMIGFAVRARLLPGNVDYSSGNFDLAPVYKVVSGLKSKKAEEELNKAISDGDARASRTAAFSAVDTMIAEMTNTALNSPAPSKNGENTSGQYHRVLADALAGDGLINAQESLLLENAFAVYEQEMRLKLPMILSQYPNLSKEDYTAAIQRGTQVLEAQRQFLSNADTGVLKAIERHNKNILTNNKAKIYSEKPAIVSWTTLIDMGFDSALVSKFAEEDILGLMAEAASGELSLQKKQTEMTTKGASKAEVDAMMRATIDGLSSTLQDPNANIDKIVKNLYVDKSGIEIIDDLSRDNPLPIFQKLYAPSITEKLRGTASFKDYVFAADRQFQLFAKPLADTALAEVKDYDAYTVKYDEAASTFTVVPNPSVVIDYLTNPALYTAKKRMTDLNGFVQYMKPIVEADGGNMKDYLAVKLQAPEFNKAGYEGGFIKQMLDAIMGSDEDEELGGSAGDDRLSEDITTKTLVGFEGFINKAAWDVNAYRVGFGSDTVTREDGTIVPVTKNTKITKADAVRDLKRRIPQFQKTVIEDIGEDVWNNLSEKQRAALTSIAYNYGSLPAKVVKAIGAGQDVAASIESLQGHNGGINRRRRLKEAALYRG